jgi:hypothetical protein
MRRTYRIPDDTAAGAWYIHVACDEGGLTGDYRLGNNIRWKRISIR